MLIPNLNFGGAQRVFHDHGKVLSERYEVLECAFNLEQGHAFPTNNRVISLEVPAGVNILDKTWQFLRRCWKLYWLKSKERPAMTISHLEGADYVNILSFGPGKKVLVIHGSKLHDREIDSSYGWLRRKVLLPFLYKQADLLITVSEGIRYELVHHFNLSAEKVITIYNFFSINHLKRLAESIVPMPLSVLKNKYRLITSGRLAKQKNQLSLMHIMKALNEQYQLPVQLFLAGDGPLKEMLINECRKLQLSVQECNDLNEVEEVDIIFLGYQANPFRLYRYMHLFLLPSAWEGFPMALGEAMTLDIPVLSADCPTGPLELLEPEWQQCYPVEDYPRFTANGVLLPVPKPEEMGTIDLWANTINQVLQDQTRMNSMKKSAQERMLLLDKEVMKGKWLEIDYLVNLMETEK